MPAETHFRTDKTKRRRFLLEMSAKPFETSMIQNKLAAGASKKNILTRSNLKLCGIGNLVK